VIETTVQFSMFSLFWENLEAHCFQYFLTVLCGSQSEKGSNGELPDSSETVKIAKSLLWSQLL